mgnify:CR=1 FL=1
MDAQRASRFPQCPRRGNIQFVMKLSKYSISLLSSLVSLATYAQEHDHAQMLRDQAGHDHTRPDSHAPISVMAEHSHSEGEWMLSYRFMSMDMEGLRRGRDGISPADAFAANYTVAPTSMSMDMHMFGGMKAISDKNTLMLMVPYLETEMDHAIFPMASPLIGLNGGASRFTTNSSGWGDLKAGILHTMWQEDGRNVLIAGTIGLPTGSIGEKGIIPGPGGLIDRQLPAPMQLGSGSFEFRPTVTYNSSYEDWSWGTQASAIVRLDDNNHGYQLGDSFTTQAWVSKPISHSLALNGRLAYTYTNQLSGTQTGVGQHPPFARSRDTVTTAFSKNYGGEMLKAAIGANFVFNEGRVKGHRLAVEIGLPIHQDLYGIQLEADWTLTIGWQLAGR